MDIDKDIIIDRLEELKKDVETYNRTYNKAKKIIIERNILNKQHLGEELYNKLLEFNILGIIRGWIKKKIQDENNI